MFNVITTRSLLNYFRKTHTRMQGLYQFNCVRSYKADTIESARHVARFDLVLASLIKKGWLAALEKGQYRTVINDRTAQLIQDDAEATV